MADVETQLADLRGMSLEEITRLSRKVLRKERTTLISQVEKPRPNIGTGPPGRAD